MIAVAVLAFDVPGIGSAPLNGPSSRLDQFLFQRAAFLKASRLFRSCWEEEIDPFSKDT